MGVGRLTPPGSAAARSAILALLRVLRAADQGTEHGWRCHWMMGGAAVIRWRALWPGLAYPRPVLLDLLPAALHQHGYQARRPGSGVATECCGAWATTASTGRFFPIACRSFPWRRLPLLDPASARMRLNQESGLEGRTANRSARWLQPMGAASPWIEGRSGQAASGTVNGAPGPFVRPSLQRLLVPAICPAPGCWRQRRPFAAKRRSAGSGRGAKRSRRPAQQRVLSMAEAELP